MPESRILFIGSLDDAHQCSFFLAACKCVKEFGVVLAGIALVNQQGGVAAIVHDEVRTRAVGEGDGAFGAPPIVFQGLAFPCEDGGTRLGDGSRSVVLRGIDVARAPAHRGAQLDQSLDEAGRLDGHVQRAHDFGALQRLRVAVFLAQRYQAGHFVFRYLNFLASPSSQVHVGHQIGQFVV